MEKSNRLSKELIEFTKNGDKTIADIMKRFDLPRQNYRTLILRLKENGIKFKENRGSKLVLPIEKIIKFTRKKNKSIDDVIEHFDLPKTCVRTLWRRVKENDIVLRENRGRKRIVF